METELLQFLQNDKVVTPDGEWVVADAHERVLVSFDSTGVFTLQLRQRAMQVLFDYAGKDP
eukprot:gene6553-15991_t